MEEGESPSDFVSCECGGSLQYYESLEEAYGEKPNEINKTSKGITSEKVGIIKDGEIIKESYEIIGTGITDNRKTVESLLKDDLDDAQDFISTIQNKRKEIKTHKNTNYILISFFIIIILLIILILAGKTPLSLPI